MLSLEMVIEGSHWRVYDPDGPAEAGQPWLAWSVTNDAQGRVTNELTGLSAGLDGNPGVADPADITGDDVGKGLGYAGPTAMTPRGG